MKVTKRYCDICGDEIPVHSNQTVSFSGYPDKESSICSSKNLTDVCRDCGSEFFKLYKNLQVTRKQKLLQLLNLK